MKIIYSLIILVLVCGCKSSEVSSDLQPINTKVVYYDNGVVKAVGNVEATFAKGNSFRIGLWSEFYENGKLKESGNYKLDYYTQCCTAGLCEGYYSYKIGEWIYYHNNGSLKAKGVFQLGEKYIKTSCEGGDKVNIGLVNDQWKFYDKNGIEIVPSQSDITEIEEGSFINQWDMMD